MTQWSRPNKHKILKSTIEQNLIQNTPKQSLQISHLPYDMNTIFNFNSNYKQIKNIIIVEEIKTFCIFQMNLPLWTKLYATYLRTESFSY